MSDIDLSAFHYYDRPAQFDVDVNVSGRMTITVRADSKQDARAQVEKMIEDDPEGERFLEMDEVEDVSVSWVRAQSTRFYLVDRPSRPGMRATSKIEPGDLPREPGEYDLAVVQQSGARASWIKTET